MEARYEYSGSVVRIRVETYRRADGGEGRREIAEHAPGVVVAAIDAEGRVLMVRQARPAVGEALEELPAGFRDGNEAAEAAAARELAEEVGVAGTLRHLGTAFTSPGFTDERLDIFLCTDLRPEAGHERDPGEDIEVLRLPLAEAAAAAAAGAYRDLKTVAGLLMAERALRRQ